MNCINFDLTAFWLHIAVMMMPKKQTNRNGSFIRSKREREREKRNRKKKRVEIEQSTRTMIMMTKDTHGTTMYSVCTRIRWRVKWQITINRWTLYGNVWINMKQILTKGKRNWVMSSFSKWAFAITTKKKGYKKFILRRRVDIMLCQNSPVWIDMRLKIVQFENNRKIIIFVWKKKFHWKKKRIERRRKRR